MTFNTPTTKDELYSVLQEIFYYYRIRREVTEDLVIEPLKLDRLTAEELSDEEITEQATIALSSKHQRELFEKQKELESELYAVEAKAATLREGKDGRLSAVSSRYNESIEKVKREAEKQGLAKTNIIIDKIAQLESSKNSALSLLENQIDGEIAEAESEATLLSARLNTLAEDMQVIFDLEITAKKEEIKKELEEKSVETFKYNNTVWEKEQRHAGSVTQANANLQIKRSQLSAEFFSKDQLIEMGYYADVIDCVTAYYSTMTPLEAYRDLSSEAKIMIYLEEYYSQVLYLYQMRANDQ